MSPWAVSPCASRRVPTAPAPSDHPPEDQAAHRRPRPAEPLPEVRPRARACPPAWRRCRTASRSARARREHGDRSSPHARWTGGSHPELRMAASVADGWGSGRPSGLRQRGGRSRPGVGIAWGGSAANAVARARVRSVSDRRAVAAALRVTVPGRQDRGLAAGGHVGGGLPWGGDDLSCPGKGWWRVSMCHRRAPVVSSTGGGVLMGSPRPGSRSQTRGLRRADRVDGPPGRWHGSVRLRNMRATGWMLRRNADRGRRRSWQITYDQGLADFRVSHTRITPDFRPQRPAVSGRPPSRNYSTPARRQGPDAHRIPRHPVVRHPRCRQMEDRRGQPSHPDTGEQEQAVVADHATEVGRAGRGGPADPVIPRAQCPGRRAKTDPTEDTMAFRPDPVADLSPRLTRYSLAFQCEIACEHGLGQGPGNRDHCTGE